MERLTDLNCKEWLHNWRRVLVIAGKSHLTEYPIPVPPEQVIIKSSYDERNFLVDESEKIRDLMLLTIDPEFRKDFESLVPYELMQSIEEKFHKPVEEERARIFKRLAECKLKEGSNIDSHVLRIEAYIGELYKLGYSMSQESSVNTLLASLTIVSGVRVDHRHTNGDSQRVCQYKGTWARDNAMGISQERIFRFSKYAKGLDFEKGAERYPLRCQKDRNSAKMILMRLKMHSSGKEFPVIVKRDDLA
ncbi:hypothetical protein L2E82_24578 [Cichorium intybus]|uniref:Uncharacterized protein n=1 Tax=Cichorium intybus TaxID=13427 RepID=A0ACB9E0L4_CICIN|nr:hypothetical protein L2E82_24578 [Cichorium intybus]